jgi:hypothetical protein
MTRAEEEPLGRDVPSRRRENGTEIALALAVGRLTASDGKIK